jgi:hypothetical protein
MSRGTAWQAWTYACCAAFSLVLGARSALAQPELGCGAPVEREISRGEVHTYRLDVAAGAAIVIQRSVVSGTIGLLKIAVPGAGLATCTEELSFVTNGDATTVEVSDCVDDPEQDRESGEYTLVMQVVSDHPANCSQPLSCGATGDDANLKLPGESDAYSFGGEPGREVDLSLTDLECGPQSDPGPVGPLRIRVFDPDGTPLPLADTCGCEQPLNVLPNMRGLYTVLVGSCRAPRSGRYRVGYDEEDCPQGPTITFFGIATADSFVVFPDDVDPLGRPVYTRLRGHGASIVLEAKPGGNGRLPGIFTVGSPIPDLQMLVSRPLGDGNPEICDILPPSIGGVPGNAALDFSDLDVLDAMNDLGCRFDDGQGMHVGRTSGIDTCTRSNDNVSGHDFVDPTSRVQFCAVLARPWAFAFGDTIVAARVGDAGGNVGQQREIVIRVIQDESTPTPSPTATATRPRPTATSTPRPVPGCVADCNESGSVAVEELIQAINIALGVQPMDTCWQADDDSDGAVAASELVHAVANSMGGCNPP